MSFKQFFCLIINSFVEFSGKTTQLGMAGFVHKIYIESRNNETSMPPIRDFIFNYLNILFVYIYGTNRFVSHSLSHIKTVVPFVL